MKLIKNKSGVYSVRYSDREGTARSTSLGVTQLSEAKLLVKELKIEEMERAAKLDILSSEVYSKLTLGKPKKFLDVIREYEGHKRKLAASPNTITTYLAIYYQFSRDYKYDKKSVADVNAKHLYDFLNRQDGTTLSNKNLRHTALNSLFKYCVAKGYTQTNPAALVKVDKSLLKHRQKEADERVPFTRWEYKQIVDYAPYFFKEATIISYWTGLRLGDICRLEWDSISSKHMIIHTIKRDKRVKIPLGHELFGGNELINCLKSIRKEHKTFCFPEAYKTISDSKKRAKLSTYYSRILGELLIYGKSFHCLRHNFTTRLYDAGVMLEDIAKVVGHSSTKTTKKYTH